MGVWVWELRVAGFRYAALGGYSTTGVVGGYSTTAGLGVGSGGLREKVAARAFSFGIRVESSIAIRVKCEW